MLIPRVVPSASTLYTLKSSSSRDRAPEPSDLVMSSVSKPCCLRTTSCYVGQTKRHVETRLKEHRADVRKVVSDQSVVSKHRLTFNHEFDWSDPDVLHRDAFNRRREIAEMYFIKKQDRPVNLQKGTDSLPGVPQTTWRIITKYKFRHVTLLRGTPLHARDISNNSLQPFTTKLE
ncbi:hypothetical protein X777_16713 [Ooceraea biroi]|uniref:GIY-YIG domain-containing protein n=1 Tax=Ooceraea biroi TaxID=2015173 RepID=A0A026VU69_OOCBI|nr:hypothetical protein X777_16713 [Ooceraea biroi]